MNNNIKVAEKFTFWQFIQSHKYIQIPIIQRDYAQGRDSKEKIRMNFLNALIKAFTDEPIELDFVYGITENKSFEPLDGQQRLTTLFLLHWYIATKEKKVNETIKTELKKFTYKTRFSSHDFCNSLVDSNIIIDNNTKNVSEKIKNAYELREFHNVYREFYNFCTVQLSARYFDILKDRLYIYSPKSLERRSAHTV